MTKSWPKVKLGEVVQDLTSLRSFTVEDGDEITDPTISSASHTISVGNQSKGFEVRVRKRVRIEPGDLVFSRLHTQNGAFAFSKQVFHSTGTFIPLALNETKVDRQFLFWALHKFVPNLSASDTVGRETYKTTDILSLEIPLPPLSEQKRILARIEELAAQINKAKKLRKEAEDEAEAIVNSTISAEIENATTKCNRQLNRLEGVCSIITDGAHNTPRYIESGVPILTAKNVFWDRFDTANIRHISREEHEPIYRRCPVQRGDVLFINIGATTGTARKVDFDLEFT